VHAGQATSAPLPPLIGQFSAHRLPGRSFATQRDMPRKRTPKNEALAFYEFETVLPAQFYSPQRRCSLQPEKRLMLAVLDDAVLAYLRGLHVAPETEAWFEADDFTWPYSFANLCDALTLDRHAVRIALRRRRERRRRLAA
jgi:hypothetical protein